VRHRPRRVESHFEFGLDRIGFGGSPIEQALLGLPIDQSHHLGGNVTIRALCREQAVADQDDAGYDQAAACDQGYLQLD